VFFIKKNNIKNIVTHITGNSGLLATYLLKRSPINLTLNVIGNLKVGMSLRPIAIYFDNLLSFCFHTIL